MLLTHFYSFFIISEKQDQIFLHGAFAFLLPWECHNWRHDDNSPGGTPTSTSLLLHHWLIIIVLTLYHRKKTSKKECPVWLHARERSSETSFSGATRRRHLATPRPPGSASVLAGWRALQSSAGVQSSLPVFSERTDGCGRVRTCQGLLCVHCTEAFP